VEDAWGATNTGGLVRERANPGLGGGPEKLLAARIERKKE